MASPVTLTNSAAHIERTVNGKDQRQTNCPVYSAGKPIDSSTITSMTMPAPGTAAEPMEASKAVSTIVNWSLNSSGNEEPGL